MHDLKIKDPSAIYVIAQPFHFYILYVTRDLDQ